ncbi:hypothetical protein B566_EDAN008830 [Ephemera danica]|nr:hypothetical protein B566_EDAN008830 [Ephemera danica]
MATMVRLGVALLAALLTLYVHLDDVVAADDEPKNAQPMLTDDEISKRGYQNWLASIDQLSNKYVDKDKYVDTNKDKYADTNKDKLTDKNKDKYAESNRDKYTETNKNSNKDKYTDKNKLDGYKDKYGESFSYSFESFERPTRPNKPSRPNKPYESSEAYVKPQRPSKPIWQKPESSEENGRPQRPHKPIWQKPESSEENGGPQHPPPIWERPHQSSEEYGRPPKPWEKPPPRPQRPPKDSVSESEEYEAPHRPQKPVRPPPPHNFLLDDPYYSSCCIDIQSSLATAMRSLDNIAVSVNSQMEGIAEDMNIIRNITAQQDIIAESIRTNSFKQNIITNEIQSEATIINQMVTLLVEAAYSLGFALNI